MTESATIPEYGALIKVEDCTAGFYLREKALDAVQEQVVDEANEALSELQGRSIVAESDTESLADLKRDLLAAHELVKVAWEIRWAKTPVEDDDPA